MKLYTLNNASRELARWRELLRTSGGRGSARREGDAASEFPITQWPTTEWSDTLPAAALGIAAHEGPRHPAP